MWGGLRVVYDGGGPDVSQKDVEWVEATREVDALMEAALRDALVEEDWRS